MASGTHVQIGGVGKRYGGVAALAGLDLELGPGITGLLGPNGAGKTIRILATLLPQRRRGPGQRLAGRRPGRPDRPAVPGHHGRGGHLRPPRRPGGPGGQHRRRGGHGGKDKLSVARNQIEVAVPPSVVFAMLADPARYRDWVVGAKEIRGFDHDWPAPGASFRHRFGLGPAAVSDVTTVLAADPPAELVLVACFGPVGGGGPHPGRPVRRWVAGHHGGATGQRAAWRRARRAPARPRHPPAQR